MGDLLKKVQVKEEKQIEIKEHPVKKLVSTTSKNKMISVKLNDQPMVIIKD